MSTSGGCSGWCRCSRVRSRWRRPRRSPGTDAGPAVAAAGRLLAAGPAAHGARWPVPVRDAGDTARLRGGAAGRGRGAGRGGRRAGRVRAAGGRAGRGRAADQHRRGRPPPGWLDAEDATMRQVLAWAMQHDAAIALRLAVALAPWWLLRGRLAGQYPLLREAAGRAAPGSGGWCAAQFWLGFTAAFSRRSGRGAGPLHRGPRRHRGPGAVPGAGRLPGRPVGWYWRTWAGSPRRPTMAAAPWPWPGSLATRPGRRWPWCT